MPGEKIAVVTGASSGIGLETARGLAAKGLRVAMVCRDAGRGEAARRRLATAAGAERFDLLVGDLSSQAQTRRLADEIRERFDRVDVLVHNAGVLYSHRTLSEDGIEMQLAVNHLAPFLLTHLLLDRLRATQQGRIVSISSRVHLRGRIAFDDLKGERRYSAVAAYAQSKLANVLFTYELARRLAGTAVTANCVFPGLVRTDIGYKHATRVHALLHWLLCRFAASPEVAARGIVRVACDDDLAGVSGRCFSDGRVVRSSAASCDEDLAARLWRVSAELTGLPRE